MRSVAFAAVALSAGLLSAAEPTLVAWQTKSGFVPDTTVEAVRFAETNGFGYVRLEVKPTTDLPALLSAVGPRLGVWIDFVSYDSARAKTAVDQIAAAGIGPERVVFASGTRWVLESLRSKFPAFRRVWDCRLDYDYVAKNWTVPDARGKGVPCATADEVAAAVESFVRGLDVWGVAFPSRRFMVEPTVISALRKAGLKVVVNEANDPVTAGYYRRAGADVLTAAHPSFAREAAWPTEEPKRVKYVGHRGGDDYLAPEHSAAMARLAAKQRLDILKLDVHETKDGAIVTSHDPGMKRVYGVDMQIKDHTLAELKVPAALPRAGYTNEHLQTLQEILHIARDGVGEFWIDFKAFTPSCIEKSLAVIDAENVARSRIMVATYSRPALEYMRDRYPDIRRVMHISPWIKYPCGRWQITFNERDFDSLDDMIGEIARRQRELGLFGVNIPGGISPFGSFRTETDALAKIKKLGLWVSIYFPVDPVSADYYRRAGADAFVTGSSEACERRGR